MFSTDKVFPNVFKKQSVVFIRGCGTLRTQMVVAEQTFATISVLLSKIMTNTNSTEKENKQRKYF